MAKGGDMSSNVKIRDSIPESPKSAESTVLVDIIEFHGFWSMGFSLILREYLPAMSFKCYQTFWDSESAIPIGNDFETTGGDLARGFR